MNETERQAVAQARRDRPVIQRMEATFQPRPPVDDGLGAFRGAFWGFVLVAPLYVIAGAFLYLAVTR